MKKYIKILLLILVAIAIGYLYLASQNEIPRNTPSEHSTDKNKRASNFTFEYEGQKLTASWLIVDSAEKIILYPNFSEKLTSQEAILKNNCNSLTSGGFYTEDDKPIALFISEGTMLRQSNSNNLANGFFTITYDGQTEISNSEPTGDIRIGLQSGPVFLLNSSFQNIASVNNEQARRIVVGLTAEDKIIFLVIYQNSSAFLGPKLADIPEVLELISDDTGLTLKDALNLDGGAASAFYGEDESLSELSLLGSYFCIK